MPPFHGCLHNPDQLQAILIDAGGVILDDTPVWNRWQRRLVRLFRERGEEISLHHVRHAARAVVQQFSPSLSRSVVYHLGGDEQLFKESWNGFSIGRPIVGTRHVLEQLRSYAPLALLANQASDVRVLLAEDNLDSLFDLLVISDEVGLSKPDPRIFRYALARLGAQPERTAMIGDRIDTDIAPARSLNLLAIRVRRGPYYWQQPLDATMSPHLTVPTLAAVLSHLMPASLILTRRTW